LWPQGFARKQHQGFHLGGMTPGGLNRVVDAEQPRSSYANRVAVDAGLRQQIPERRIQVERPPLLPGWAVQLSYLPPLSPCPRLSTVRVLMPAAASFCATLSHEVRVRLL
jgi:hypothetical protein